MSSYIRPLRRKLGVVTLVLACVFAAGWVRSNYFSESLAWSMGRNLNAALDSIHVHTVTSSESYFVPGTLEIRSADPLLIANMESMYRYPVWDWFVTASGDRVKDLNIKWYLLVIGLYELPEASGNPGWRILIPYWILTMPLTIVSAYLLLSKPRSSQPKPLLEA